jgi:hypothetical protein
MIVSYDRPLSGDDLNFVLSSIAEIYRSDVEAATIYA